MSDIRIRQICLVAHDLERIQHQLERVFGIAVAHRDPGVGRHGLHNILMPVGNQLLETVAPLPGHHDTAGGRYLARRGGDGGYMVIMQVPEASYPAYRGRVESLGVRIISEPGTGLEGTGGIQLHPKDVPGAIAEFRWNMEEDREDGGWWPAGPDWQAAKHTDLVDAIVAAEIQADDPTALAARWGEVLNEPVGRDDAGRPALALAGSTLRFVPLTDGRPEGLCALDIRAVDRAAVVANARAAGCLSGEDEVSICGIRLNLV
tara:strand:- start:1357 stop:2142 length:786 start_codon:yes stop_codon:yes gene_type:complete